MLKSLSNISAASIGKNNVKVLTLKNVSTKIGKSFKPAIAVCCGVGFFGFKYLLFEKEDEVARTIGAIQEHEIYPKIYRLANGNVKARKALGYRIDPAHWGSWDYFKLMLRRWMDGFAETAATSNVMSPLLARFLLPVHGSRQKGVIQVWASREKVEDAWELERMELKFSPRDSPAFNINANNLGLEDVAKVRDDQNDRINAVDDDLSTWDHSTDLPRMATLMNREIETILIWVDSGTPPRSQLEDPSVDVATLPDLDDPWKLALEDIEEPVEYITEE